MAVSKSLNGTTYSIPETGDGGGWGTELSNFLQAVADHTLQKTGGSFTLTAAADFGATYGLKSAYFSSRTTPSTTGIIRLGNNESVAWRNAANGADLAFKVNASNVLEFDGNPLLTLALGTANYSLRMNSGATAYEWATIVNAQVDAAAAIAYSKLNLATSIVNADISASASIAFNKMEDIAAGSIVMGNGSNLPTLTALSGDISLTENGVTAIVSGVIVNDDINASAAIVDTKLATISTAGKVSNSATTAASANTASAIVARDGSGNFSAGTITANLTGNVTGNLATLTTEGDVLYRGAANGTRLGIGSAGQVLTVNAGATAPEWSDGGGGSGEKNYITNHSAKSAITGWTGVGDLDVARTTTAGDLPREYTTAAGIKITADSNTQSVADYVYYDFTLDDVDLNKKLKIQWAQKQTGSYVASDLAVVITTQADRTTAVATPQTTNIPAVDGVFSTSFDTGSTATLSLVIRATTDMATDAGLVISDVIVGPGIQPQGAARSAALAWTPSNTQGFGTIASVNLFYERDGEDLLIYGKFTAGTVAASEAQISLPSSLTVGSQKGSATALAVGVWTRNIATVTSVKKGTMICQSGQTYIKFSMDDYNASTAPYTASNGSAILSTGEIMGIEARVPIAEWAGSGVVNLAQNDVEYASVGGTWDADSSTTVYGPSGVAMGGALAAQRTKTVTFQTPFQTGDTVEVQMSTDGVVWGPANGFVTSTGQAVGQYYSSASALAGFAWKKSSSTAILVYFGRYASFDNDDTAVINWGTDYWRVVKHKAGQAVGFGAATSTSSGLVSREYTSVTASTFQGNLGGSASASVNITVSRVGNIVNISIPVMITIVPTTSSISLNANTAIPSWARPLTAAKSGHHYNYNNGAYSTTIGLVLVGTDGIIKVHRDITSPAYTNSANAGWYSINLTYSVD